MKNGGKALSTPLGPKNGTPFFFKKKITKTNPVWPEQKTVPRWLPFHVLSLK